MLLVSHEFLIVKLPGNNGHLSLVFAPENSVKFHTKEWFDKRSVTGLLSSPVRDPVRAPTSVCSPGLPTRCAMA